MFAFSIFWTYLWFSQFMLIWYANIPEETVYFKPRVAGCLQGIFFLNLIINFLAPLLILMRRSAKRNYTTDDLYGGTDYCWSLAGFLPDGICQAVFTDHVPMNLFDFGIAVGFVGLIMFVDRQCTGEISVGGKKSSVL